MEQPNSKAAGAGRPNPAAIFELTTAYWASATLVAANELGLFSQLACGEQSAPQLAQELAADPRALEMLANACCGLGLLRKNGNAYGLSDTARAFLVPQQSSYLGSAVRWSGQQYNAWGQLAAAVRNGQPAVEPADHLGADPDQTRTFVLAMHERAKGLAGAVAQFLDLNGCTRLLDVGGGPGTYAVMLARKQPSLQITVLDLPGVVAVARELIAEAGQSERVHTTAGDATTGEYGEAVCDAVLFCGVLHQFSPATIQRMLAGARRALVPGGRVVICDMMLDEAKAQPVFSALFSLQMMLTSREGGVFAAAECVNWLQAAGFTAAQAQPLPPPLPYTVVSARVPGN